MCVTLQGKINEIISISLGMFSYYNMKINLNDIFIIPFVYLIDGRQHFCKNGDSEALVKFYEYI